MGIRALTFGTVMVLAAGACAGSDGTPAPAGTSVVETFSPGSPTEGASAGATSQTGAIALRGRWTTAITPLRDIREALLGADVSAEAAEAWVEEVGSPATFRFQLEFDGDAFVHRQQLDRGTFEEDESGRYALEGERLILVLGDDPGADTYTFEIALEDDAFRLRWLSSTDSGSPEDQEHHRRYTVAFYCAAVFTRD